MQRKKVAHILNKRSGNEKSSFFSEKALKRNNIILFAAIFILIFLRPIVSSIESSRVIFSASLSLLIISAVSSLDFNKKKLVRLTYAALISLPLIWLDFFVSSLAVQLISFFVQIIFFIYITYSMIIHVAREKNVTATLILNAINSYILIGIVFALLFLLAEVIYKFLNINVPTINFGYTNSPTLFDYIYFAFITMTTVGYGDASPAVPLTKSLAMLTAITSQLYLTILVAMLVGKFLSNEKNRTKK